MLPIYYVQSDSSIAIHHLTPRAKRNDPVIIMCHPTGFCGPVFTCISAHLRNLNVFALDMRNHGYSGRANLSDWKKITHDLDCAYELIGEFSDQRRFFGVGISSGSSVLILHSQKSPKRYKGLYLSEPILFNDSSDLTKRNDLAITASKRRENFQSNDDAYTRFLKTPLVELSQSALGLYCVHGFREISEGITLRCLREDEKAIYLSGSTNGVYEALAEIEVPCVIAYGENSTTISPQFANEISSKIVHSKVEMIKNAGHFTLYDRPFQAAQKITAFINEVESSVD